jgi:hypothetical protein
MDRWQQQKNTRLAELVENVAYLTAEPEGVVV